jgi:16S rRNA (uracil1498-N3)-methyltransferase
MPCYYAPELSSKTNRLSFRGKEYHHLANVMRVQPGDVILLTNGKGLLADFKVESLDGKQIDGEIMNIKHLPPAQPAVATSFALLKNKNDELIVEKLTELGVREFFPITTKRTIRKPGKNTTEKFQKTAIAAIKQCENAYLPKIHETKKLEKALQNIQKAGYEPVVALEVGKHILLENIIKQEPQQNYCLLFGPEGGFSSHEIEFLQAQKVKFFTLGNHILRAETAAISAVSQILNYYLKNDPNYY